MGESYESLRMTQAEWLTGPHAQRQRGKKLRAALDGWEQAEADLTRLREWEGEYLAAVQLASECFADLDAAGVSFSSIAWQMCLALTQENSDD